MNYIISTKISILLSILMTILLAYIASPIITQKEIRIYDDKIKLIKRYLEVIKISSIINKKDIKTIDIQLATHIGRFLYYRSPQELWYNIIIQTKSKQYTYPVNFQPKGGIDLLKLISSFVDESILTENYKEILRKNRRYLIF